MAHSVSTIGFSNEHPGPLKRHSDVEGALVVDVRYVPTSKYAEWNRPALEQLFFPGPSRYVWAPQLALVGRSIGMEDVRRATTGIKALLEWRKHFPLVLLCCCPNPHACSRGFVALVLHKMGIEVKELQWPERKPLYFRQDPAESVRQIREAQAEQAAREAEAAKRRVVQEVLL